MNLTDDNFQKEVIEFDGVTLVDFWAPWCTPCKIQGPIVDKLAEKFKSNEKVKIGKLDTDQNPNISMSNQIFSIPTLIIYKNGEIAEKFVGLRSQEDLEKKIQELL